jgi:hypothetical protein
VTGRHQSSATLAVLLTGLLALSACSLAQRTYRGEPLDLSAANVVPAAGADAATIQATAPDQFLTPGIE